MWQVKHILYIVEAKDYDPTSITTSTCRMALPRTILATMVKLELIIGNRYHWKDIHKMYKTHVQNANHANF